MFGFTFLLRLMLCCTFHVFGRGQKHGGCKVPVSVLALSNVQRAEELKDHFWEVH